MPRSNETPTCLHSSAYFGWLSASALTKFQQSKNVGQTCLAAHYQWSRMIVHCAGCHTKKIWFPAVVFPTMIWLDSQVAGPGSSNKAALQGWAVSHYKSIQILSQRYYRVSVLLYKDTCENVSVFQYINTYLTDQSYCNTVPHTNTLLLFYGYCCSK